VRLDEKILDYIKRIGPSTPIEVAQRVGSDSLIVAAILVDAASQHRIKRSKRKAGGSHRYYYYEEQLKMLQKRINSVLQPPDKQMIQKVLNEKVLSELNLQPQEVSILSGLEDLITGFTFEHENRIVRGWCSPNINEEKARETILKKIKPAEPEVKAEEPKAKAEVKEPEIKKKSPEEKEKRGSGAPGQRGAEKGKRESPKKEEKESEEDLKEQIRREILEEIKGSFVDNIMQKLEKHNIDIKDQREIKKGKEYELVISVPTNLGSQKYLVRVFSAGKKKVGAKDIYSLGMEAVSKKIPAIAVSSSGFAKTAVKKWKEELQDIMMLMTEDDLAED
jgi:hypothetical protein|tara:strand:+ start:967 stop:1971 length:1005 start_codon:yes stop_codon:yes gene_type:complete